MTTLASDSIPVKIARRSWWRSAGVFALWPLIIGIGLGMACAQACGDSLGLFFGGVIFAAIIVPPLVMAAEGWLGWGLNTFAVVAGTASVWFVAGVKEQGTTASQWAGCSAVLLAYAMAAAGLAVALRSMRFAPVAASAVAVLLGLAWMTWPIWLAPVLEGHSGPALAEWLVPAHPLITINGLLPHLGIWNEQSIAYHLTNLGNDVAYELPRTPWVAAAVHGAIGAGFAVIAMVALRYRRSPRSLRGFANGHAAA